MKGLVGLLLVVFIVGVVDAGWKITTKKGGKTTVKGDEATMAAHEQDEKARAAYDKDIADAPRRAPTDPIRVTILNPIWDGKDKDRNENNMNKGLFDEMKKEPLFVMAISDIPRRSGKDRAEVDLLIKEAVEMRKGAQIYVYPQFGTEAALGRTKDGKAKATNALMYKTDVYSAYEPNSKSAKELGTLFQSKEMIEKIAKRVGSIIKDDFGPRLPSEKAVAEITRKHMSSELQRTTGIEPGDDTKTKLKKLFKPRNQVN